MIRSALKTLWWATLDTLAHFLYQPTMLGKRSARARWHHRLHLIPGKWLGEVCDRYDLTLGHGEPVEVRGPDGYGCAHMGIWSNNLVGVPTTGCGCELTPLYKNSAA